MEGAVFYHTETLYSIGKSNIRNKGGCWQNSRDLVCKQKRITVDENFLRSLLVAPFILPGAFLLVVLIVLAAAAHVLVPAHTHLILIVLVTINLRGSDVTLGCEIFDFFTSAFSSSAFLILAASSSSSVAVTT